MRKWYKLFWVCLATCLILFKFQAFGQDAFNIIRYGLVTQEELHDSFKKHLKPAASSQYIGYLEFPSHHLIDHATLLYVKKALKFFKAKQVAFVVLRISCKGGEFYPISEISNKLQQLDVNDSIPIFAYVDKQALGFASLLIFACRYVTIAPQSEVGAISLQDVSYLDKKNENLVSECMQMATLFGRPWQVIEALLDPDCLLVKRGDKLLILEDEEAIRFIGESPDIIFKGKKEPWVISSDALIELGLADFEVAQQGPLIVVAKSSLSIPCLQEPYLSSYQTLDCVQYHIKKAYFFASMTHPALNALLFLLAALGLFYQFFLGKWSYFFIPTSCLLGVLLYSGYILDSLSLVEMCVFSMGFVIFLMERTFLKGASALGILGCFLILVSMMSILLPGIGQFSLFDFESFSMQNSSLIQRMVWLMIAMLTALVSAFNIRKALIKRGAQGKNFEGLQGIDFHSKYVEDKLPFIGCIGMTDSPLKPFGKVKIQGKIYDAIAHSEALEKYQKIIVVKHKQGKVVVKSETVLDSLE